MRRVVAPFVLLVIACGGSPPAEPAEARHGHGAHHGRGHHHDFSDVERFAAMFDDPARDAWQRPDEVLALLELAPGTVVADLGAGTGYFTARLAPAVGPSGRVIALDVEPRMIEHMRARFAEAGVSNVELRAVAPDEPGLAPASVDRILIVDTWHHLDDRTRYGERLRAALRPGGFVLVVDYTEESPHGPPAGARLSAEAVAAELESSGMRARVLEEELPYQYVVRGEP